MTLTFPTAHRTCFMDLSVEIIPQIVNLPTPGAPVITIGRGRTVTSAQVSGVAGDAQRSVDNLEAMFVSAVASHNQCRSSTTGVERRRLGVTSGGLRRR